MIPDMRTTKTIHALLFMLTAVLIAACSDQPRLASPQTPQDAISYAAAGIEEAVAMVEFARDTGLIDAEQVAGAKEALREAVKSLDAASMVAVALRQSQDEAEKTQLKSKIDIYLGQALILLSTVKAHASGGEQ